MKTTKVTGQLCVGELRLAAIDVGFDLRLTDTAVRFPAYTPASAGFDRNGRDISDRGLHARRNDRHAPTRRIQGPGLARLDRDREGGGLGGDHSVSGGLERVDPGVRES